MESRVGEERPGEAVQRQQRKGEKMNVGISAE